MKTEIELNIKPTKYTSTCPNCQKEVAIQYEEWLALSEIMMTFSGLKPSQKETVMLIMDGLKFRQQKQNEQREFDERQR